MPHCRWKSSSSLGPKSGNVARTSQIKPPCHEGSKHKLQLSQRTKLKTWGSAPITNNQNVTVLSTLSSFMVAVRQMGHKIYQIKYNVLNLMSQSQRPPNSLSLTLLFSNEEYAKIHIFHIPCIIVLYYYYK